MDKESQPKLSTKKVQELIGLNFDARQYFFTKADERWLDWLWRNGFLDVMKEKAKDITRYGYRTPELNYLVRVAEKNPKSVIEKMLDVPISSETFNPEVVDRFLRICSTLPAEQLARIVPKIREEKWIPLMESFNQWGFEYEKMLQTLANAKDYNSILVLAESILAVRTKEEIEKTTNRIMAGYPFYFRDLSYMKIFKHLTPVDNEYEVKALELTTKIMAKIVLLGSETEGKHIFTIEEAFHLFNVDFFALEPGQMKRLSYRDDVRELAAFIKVLACRLIGSKCNATDVVRTLYERYIKSLPDSRTMWRLRLFVLSLCPETFKAELKTAFFRLFEVDRYHELISGTEYKKALRTGFPVLSESDKRKYVNQVYEYFSKHA